MFYIIYIYESAIMLLSPKWMNPTGTWSKFFPLNPWPDVSDISKIDDTGGYVTSTERMRVSEEVAAENTFCMPCSTGNGSEDKWSVQTMKLFN